MKLKRSKSGKTLVSEKGKITIGKGIYHLRGFIRPEAISINGKVVTTRSALAKNSRRSRKKARPGVSAPNRKPGKNT